MKYLIAAFALVVLISASAQEGETLADALKANSVPVAPLPRLSARITSSAVLNNNREFVIAYYLANDKNELSWPLYISKLTKTSGTWQNSELMDLKLSARNTGTIWDKESTDCIGSVLSIEEYQGRYFLNLHFNPSAGCLLILKPDLTVDQTLPGGAEAFVAGRVLWSLNMVHFADVHPAELWMYNPATHKSIRVYPRTSDPFRRAFEEQLAPLIDTKTCAANNWACDPKRFTSELGAVEVNEQTKAFALHVQLSPEGFMPADEVGNWVEDYVYLFRVDPFVWRVFPAHDLKPTFGKDSLRDLLTPDMLQKVFATPAAK